MNNFIFCTLPVFSDWAGIAGLGVGIASLILTLLTFWKVRTIQAVVDELQNRNLLRTRLPEILNELNEISNNLYRLYSDRRLSREKNAQIQRSVSTVRVHCDDIKRYLGKNTEQELNDAGFGALSQLSTLLESQVFDESFNERYRDLLLSLTVKMKSFLREMEVRIS